ncbi:uncharacterized protein LOC132557113 [Ylistrum balloti]|uniref:uncharacterized protein LOC132557113 n=1 Tax=Ylistrum balloti TaxID=509963 RepID=UPI002905C2F8|nr:uncharacterized protein LOC132557113 [Ylistrum balloti]
MLRDSKWLLGATQLSKPLELSDDRFPLVEPEEDKEIRPEAVVMKTELIPAPVTYLFDKFSRWSKLVKVISHVMHAAKLFKQGVKPKNQDATSGPTTPGSMSAAKTSIIKEVQKQFYKTELDLLHQGKPIPKTSSLLTLCPKLDKEGILRVGGRLDASDVEGHRKHPVLIPGSHHIATLLVRRCHESVSHQGRHFTEGAVREAGYWVTGGKRLISLIIHRCVTCRRLCSRLCVQKMADLPSDRVVPTPPFSCVGVDVFGPWTVITRRTRGGAAANKRWAALFTCMSTRAVHIEVLEEMSSSCFINAVRRLYSIRGHVKQFRSDQGTNFIGATADIGVSAVESKEMKDFLSAHDSTWTFNPPHASHFGGAWERMIGVARRILDAMFLENKGKELTHEVLTTLMAEVCAILNARPLVPVSSDPEQPFVLSPSVLLTQKTEDQIESLAHLDVKDMYRAQWRHVQVLAEKFWSRWRREYLSLLQPRRKWQEKERNVKVGDVVLMKDTQSARNDWPLGVVTRAIASEDGLVRKVELRVRRNGKSTSFQRPVTELAVLVSDE